MTEWYQMLTELNCSSRVANLLSLPNRISSAHLVKPECVLKNFLNLIWYESRIFDLFE